MLNIAPAVFFIIWGIKCILRRRHVVYISIYYLLSQHLTVPLRHLHSTHNIYNFYIISGNFDCLDDDLPPDPVGVILFDSKMTPVWRSRPGASEGFFSLHGSGRYELCIQNGNIGHDDTYAPKDGNDREIGFAIRVVPPARELENEAGPDTRLNSHLLELSQKLMAGLETMSDHQEYMRERENRHTILADITFNRVVQWTMLEACVLMLIACGQVLYLKKFFEQRRYL